MVGVVNGIIRLYFIEVKRKECGGHAPSMRRFEIAASQIIKKNISMRVECTKQHPIWKMKMEIVLR